MRSQAAYLVSPIEICTRIEALRKEFDSIQAFLVVSSSNVRYLSNFTGSFGFLLLGKDFCYLLTDARYTFQVDIEVGSLPISTVTVKSMKLFSAIREILGQHKVKRFAFEANYITVKNYTKLKCSIDKIVKTILPKYGMVERLRKIKSPAEIRQIKASASLLDNAFEFLYPKIKAGVTEKSLSTELQVYLLKNGADFFSFPPIVAAGIRSAMAHGKATDKIIRKGDFLVIDFGASINGYHADFTRTLLIGKTTEEHKKVYTAVLEAQQKSIASLKPGIRASEIDAIARKSLLKKGLDKYFTHGLGHGVGLEIHESPSLSLKSKDIITEGMVFTIEPGVYIKNLGGVRIEDTVLMTSKGVEYLTSFPKSKFGVH